MARTNDATEKVTIDLAAGTATYAGQKVSVAVTGYTCIDSSMSYAWIDVESDSASDLGAFSHTFTSIESATGLDRISDVLLGSDRTDVVEIFTPGKGLGGLRGSFGETYIEDGNSNDSVNGRGGNDVVSHAAETYSVDVDLSRGTTKGIPYVLDFHGEQISYNAFTDRLAGIEGVYGSKSDDTLTGDSGTNWINGGAGDDALDGDGGYDFATYAFFDGQKDVDDVIDLSGGDSIGRFRNLEELAGATDDRTGSAIITVGQNTLTIEGVLSENLTVENFDFA